MSSVTRNSEVMSHSNSPPSAGTIQSNRREQRKRRNKGACSTRGFEPAHFESAGMPRTPDASRHSLWHPQSRSVWGATYSVACSPFGVRWQTALRATLARQFFVNLRFFLLSSESFRRSERLPRPENSRIESLNHPSTGNPRFPSPFGRGVGVRGISFARAPRFMVRGIFLAAVWRTS